MIESHALCYCQAARRSARYISRLYDRHLSPTGINIQQLSMLSIVGDNPGVLIADLAAEMVMERTTLLRGLKPLQQAEWVLTEPSGTGRSLALRLSRKGKQKVAEANPIWNDAQREFEAQFGKSEAAHLRTGMKQAFALAAADS